MTPAVREFLLAVSNSLVGSIIVKVTVSTALGLLAVWLARGNRAAVRHALLVAMFGAVLLLPVSAVLMPPLHIGVATGVASPTALPPFGIGAYATTVGAGTYVAAVAPASKLSLSNSLLVGWTAGVVVFLIPVVVGLWQIRSLRQSGLPWRHGQSLVTSLAVDAGIRRRVEVLLHEALPGPMTCGLVRPVIVLPRDAESWNAEDLKRAIVHELEHVRRGDSMSRCFARIVCAAYWFHPFVWIAWRKLALEAERACDDAVLRRSDAMAYADQLVDLAKRLSAAQRSPLLAMANRADLATRVGAVLDNEQRRGRAGKVPLTLACLAAAALVFAVAPLTLVGAPQATSDKPSFEIASVKLHKPTPGPLRSTKDVGAAGITFTNVDLNSSIRSAYGVAGYQIAGGLTWFTPDRYDIVAKAAAAAPKTQLMLMLQTLLEDRFKLRVHREIKDLPVFGLVVGKKGLKIHPGKEGGETEIGGTTHLINSRGMSMKDLASFLSQFTATSGRPVVDITGLSGVFDITLDFVRDDLAGGDNNADPNIFAALEEIGLKLESRTSPIEVLMIDHAEKPSDN